MFLTYSGCSIPWTSRRGDENHHQQPPLEQRPALETRPILMPVQDLGQYRGEYNHLMDKATGAQRHYCAGEKYITISVVKKDVEEARAARA